MTRSWLFVPGDRPDRLAKVLTRGADAVIADLEDAVLPAAKDEALDAVARWVAATPAGAARVWVRVNGPEDRAAEIDALAGLPGVAGFLLPKTESPEEVAEAQRRIAVAAGGAKPVCPMIESALGLTRARAIAAGVGVHRIHLGEVDLAADLGIEPGLDEAELLPARSAVVLASRLVGLAPPVAPVSTEIDDLARFEDSTQRLRRLGFQGRACIHPGQVAVANRVFSVSREENRWAEDVLERAHDHGGAFRDADGRLVDEAVLRRARAIRDSHPNRPEM